MSKCISVLSKQPTLSLTLCTTVTSQFPCTIRKKASRLLQTCKHSCTFLSFLGFNSVLRRYSSWWNMWVILQGFAKKKRRLSWPDCVECWDEAMQGELKRKWALLHFINLRHKLTICFQDYRGKRTWWQIIYKANRMAGRVEVFWCWRCRLQR